jgi:tetratricopeptide (TPR) repeat protein
MKYSVLPAAMLVFCALAAQTQHEAHTPAKPATLVSGLGDLHHPVTTSNPEAQRFFDQGLRYIFAFNHAEAARSFQRATELDPALAMAWWGIAEAVGPNYNDPADPARFQQAHDAIEKASVLGVKASANERAYISALAKRFPPDPKADLHQAAQQYVDAMREVVKQYPDDLDLATLFAEAKMNLHPWGLWNQDGTPEPGTPEITATLESVLRRDPNHVGAIHYYIHAVEASPNPERALAGANRLAALAPGAGHLVHMPGHIYIRTGDFDSAVKTNEKAAEADRAYMQASSGGGMYVAMYYSHNLHFIAMCASMEGEYDKASQAAATLADHVRPMVHDVPPLEAFMTIPVAVEVRFHRWDQILQMAQPDVSQKTSTIFWHFARGMALAAKGKVAEAEAEQKIVSEAEHNTSPDTIFSMPVNNKTKDVLKIAENVLGARIASARNDSAAAISMLREAVAVQDTLKYAEPPDWFFPVRESLGAELLRSGKPAEAEKVFREDLERNPRNPRSLFGLRESLKAQNRSYDAQFVDRLLQSSWKNTVALKLDDLT